MNEIKQIMQTQLKPSELKKKKNVNGFQFDFIGFKAKRFPNSLKNNLNLKLRFKRSD